MCVRGQCQWDYYVVQYNIEQVHTIVLCCMIIKKYDAVSLNNHRSGMSNQSVSNN